MQFNKSVLLLAAAVATGSAMADTTVLSQDFQNSSFQGGDYLLGSSSTASTHTDYYFVNNAFGWTFSNGAAYLIDGGVNGAILLNEASPSGGASTTSALASYTLSGLTAGATYTVSFDYWGDNEPGGSWSLDEYVGGSKIGAVAGTDGAPGSTPGGTADSFSFVASSASESFGFGQSASTAGASPIFDNVVVTTSAVPEPGAAWMALAGLGLLGVAARRRQTRG